ncbi:hypothetical protein R3P38DRAFT_3420061 [Favolaschia claudopus]|uniref:Uncharacterized protein n=1 Tax=Favolaschia claudopus TaxID=2862362 RepID=A0AAW0EHI5_9AGAR
MLKNQVAVCTILVYASAFSYSEFFCCGNFYPSVYDHLRPPIQPPLDRINWAAGIPEADINVSHPHLSPLMKALWRVVRMLFGLSTSASDAENGEVFEVNFPAKSPNLALTEPITTFKPDIAGIPALTLSSMAVGAAFAPAGPIAIQSSHYPNARVVPVIIVTPPPDEQQQGNRHSDLPSSFDLDTRRAALKAITNQPRRVYGKIVRTQRAPAKGRENLRDHPNIPRLTHRQVVSPPAVVVPTAASHTKSTVPNAAQPGSTEWEKEKASQLSRAKSWSEQVKARRQSLPATSPTPTPAPAAASKRMSAPARIPLSERLNRLVASPPPAVVAPPLWGDSNVSFVIDDEEEDNRVGILSVLLNTDASFASHKVSFSPSSSISGSSSGRSISSLLDAFEENLKSSLWRGLEDFGAVLEEGHFHPGSRFEN